MNTQLAIHNDAELDAYLDRGMDPMAIDGADALDRSDLQIPRLILVQPTSDLPDGDKHQGDWYNSLTGEYALIVKAVLLSLNKGRVAFPRKFSRDSEPICGSDDAIHPRAEYVGSTVEDEQLGIEFTIGAPCAECPFSHFGANGETPLCAKGYTYALLDADSGLPFVVQMQRTATATARQINTAAKMVKRSRLFVLSSKQVKTDSGKYYEPVFALGENTPGELLQMAFQISAELGNIAARVQQEPTPANGRFGSAERGAPEPGEGEDLSF